MRTLSKLEQHQNAGGFGQVYIDSDFQIRTTGGVAMTENFSHPSQGISEMNFSNGWSLWVWSLSNEYFIMDEDGEVQETGPLPSGGNNVSSSGGSYGGGSSATGNLSIMHWGSLFQAYKPPSSYEA